MGKITAKVLLFFLGRTFLLERNEVKCNMRVKTSVEKAAVTTESIFVLGEDFRLLGAKICFKRTNSYVYCLTTLECKTLQLP